MNLLFGMLLVLGLMVLIFMGPEWFEALTKDVRVLRKAGPNR